MYDQSTRDASVLAADSFLSILLSKLDGCFDSVAILTGERQEWARAVGYTFPSKHPSPCTSLGQGVSEEKQNYWDSRNTSRVLKTHLCLQ